MLIGEFPQTSGSRTMIHKNMWRTSALYKDRNVHIPGQTKFEPSKDLKKMLNAKNNKILHMHECKNWLKKQANFNAHVNCTLDDHTGETMKVKKQYLMS